MPKHHRPIVRNGVVSTGNPSTNVPGGISVDSAEWQAWLEDHSSFVFFGDHGHLDARREKRRGRAYWYAYRWRDGKLFKSYLGKAQELTLDHLDQVSARLAGLGRLSRLSSPSGSMDWVTALDHPPAAASPAVAQSTGDVSFLSLTKVRPPALPQKLVSRLRLTRRINSPVTLLIAPSGFGKSTLLNEWRQTCGMPVAWVSLDADDNQPLRFWSTVTAALETVLPNLGQDPQSPLRMPASADGDQVVQGLANAILRAGDAPGTPPRLGLVLDDYHYIQDKAILASFQTWLEHLPPTLQLVISTHSRPALAWGHLRARGVVAELGTEDLRFTLEEGIDYLSQHARGRPWGYGDMQAIIKRTEGWAAGLALATLALDEAGGRHQPFGALTGAHNYLREYFVGSIVERQPPSVQEFLLETAILRQLTGPLCDAVTGRTDGAEMLSYLWQENLFLVRLESPDWYRYHDLFAETLCNQLERQLAAGIPRLHRRAAEWYRTQNAPADAVYHLLAIQAWEEATALIESMALRELEQFGDYARLLRWFQQLPETVMQQHKTLLRVYVRVAALTLSRTEMNQFLTRIEQNITLKPVTEQSADEHAVQAEIGRIRQLWASPEARLALLSAEGEHDDVWQILDGIVQLARYVRVDYAQAETLARELYDLARARRHLYAMLIAGGILAVHLLLDGYLRRSEAVARQMLEEAMTLRGKLPEPASIALTALSQVCYERNQLVAAHQLLLRAVELEVDSSSSNMPAIEAILRAKIQSAQGDSAAALATLQTARELLLKRPSGLYRSRDLTTYQAWVCMRQGDWAGAERLLTEAGVGESHSLGALVRAELVLKQGQAALAVELARELVQRYPQGLYLEPIMGARILLALALFDAHQVNHARQVMTEAIRLAYPEGLLRPFMDYGRTGAPLFTLVLHTSNLTAEGREFVREVLRWLGNANDANTPPPVDELTALSTAASITAREQHVLRLVAAGSSNREIAAQLSFAESTVKTHLKNIYRKLGVNSRTRAIAQARALHLV